MRIGIRGEPGRAAFSRKPPVVWLFMLDNQRGRGDPSRGSRDSEDDPEDDFVGCSTYESSLDSRDPWLFRV